MTLQTVACAEVGGIETDRQKDRRENKQQGGRSRENRLECAGLTSNAATRLT